MVRAGLLSQVLQDCSWSLRFWISGQGGTFPWEHDLKRDRVFEVLGRLRSKEVPLEMWGMQASDLQDRTRVDSLKWAMGQEPHLGDCTVS